jgi:hypothetical protein
MNKLEISLLQDRANQINEEAQRFIKKCNTAIQNSRRLQDDIAYLIEKSMVLKEEALADKCKSLAIYKLAYRSKNFFDGSDKYFSSINDDTTIALQMLEDIKQTDISNVNPLHTLRTELLALSFLPLNN